MAFVPNISEIHIVVFDTTLPLPLVSIYKYRFGYKWAPVLDGQKVKALQEAFKIFYNARLQKKIEELNLFIFLWQIYFLELLFFFFYFILKN